MAASGTMYTLEVDKSPSDELSLRNMAVVSDKHPLAYGGDAHK